MRRFIAVFTFSLLVIVGKADTISRVHVYLGDSLIADVYYGDVARIKLKRSAIDPADSLRFELYYGCGGAPAPAQYVFTLASPTEGIQLYENAPYLSPEFACSLGIVKDLADKDPGLRLINGWYRPIGTRSVTEGIRFLIELE